LENILLDDLTIVNCGMLEGCWAFYTVGWGDSNRRQLGFRHPFPGILWLILYL